MKSPLHAIVDNWKLKLLALVLALLIWVVVSGDQDISHDVRTPVEVVNRSQEYRVSAGPDPEHVTVRLSGPRRDFWSLFFQRPSLQMQIDAADDGLELFALSPGMMRIPGGGNFRVGDIQPRAVRLAFRELASGEEPSEEPAEVEDEADESGDPAFVAERTMSLLSVSVPPGMLASPPLIDVALRGVPGPVDELTRQDFQVRVPFGILPVTLPAEGLSVPVEIVGLPAGVEARAEPARVRLRTMVSDTFEGRLGQRDWRVPPDEPPPPDDADG